MLRSERRLASKATLGTVARAALLPLAMAGALFAGTAHATGRIVIVGDDYTASDEYWNLPNNNVGTLIDNSLAWLGNDATAHSALVSSWFDVWLHHSNLYQRITVAGFTQTKSSTTTWDAQTLSGHDLVVASFSAGVDVQAMVNFVNAGGNVLLITGENQSYQNVKDFAAAFGILIPESPNPAMPNGPTGFASSLSNSPLAQGVDSLYFVGPAPMLLTGTNANASMVFGFTFDATRYGLVAAVSNVPEPASMVLLAAGLLVVASRVRRQA
jgi:hypothetical protein